MRIFLNDGKVTCDLTHKDSGYLAAVSGCWDKVEGGNLILKLGEDIDFNYRVFTAVIDGAKFFGVEVEDEVKKLYEDLQNEIKLLNAERNARLVAEREVERKKERWRLLQKHGCKGCSSLRKTPFDDEWECAESGDDLPTKQCPEFLGNTCYIFLFNPFPTDKCPQKI